MSAPVPVVPTTPASPGAVGVGDTYQALVCRRFTDDLSGLAFEALSRRALAPDEIRVRVLAVALGYPDLLMTRGLYQHKPQLPYVPGMESCAEILEVGADVPAPWRPGLRVIAGGKDGAIARERIVRAAQVREIPAGLTVPQAAAFTSQAITAYVSLVRRAELRAGETLLVHGASGGVGLAAVRLGVHLGARVIATGSNALKLAAAKAAGAHEIIDLSAIGGAAGLRDRVRDLTDDRGVQVVYDPVGGDLFDASVRCLAWGGRLLVVGFADGRIPQISLNQVLIRGISLLGVRAGEYGRRFPALGAENVKAIDRLASEGVLVPHIGQELPFEAALDGFRAIAERRAVGRIVLRVAP